MLGELIHMFCFQILGPEADDRLTNLENRIKLEQQSAQVLIAKLKTSIKNQCKFSATIIRTIFRVRHKWENAFTSF